jgi:hypothetical protein
MRLKQLQQRQQPQHQQQRQRWMMPFTSNITSNLRHKDTILKQPLPMLSSMRYSMLKANNDLQNFGFELMKS